VGSASEIAALDAAITASYQELAVRQSIARRDPTAANEAAVRAISERITSQQDALAGVMQALPRPVFPTTPTTTSPSSGGGGSGGTSTTTPVEIYTPLPVSPVLGGVTSTGGSVGGGGGTSSGGGGGASSGGSGGGQSINSAGGVAGGKYGPLPPNFLGEVVPTYVLDGVPAVVGAPGVADAWNYFRDVVDTSFTDLEGAFEDIEASTMGAGTGVVLAEVGGGLVADAGGIEVISFAGALLLSEYLGGWVIQKVGEVFPNPDLFGWRPLNFIQKGIEGLGTQLQQSAEGLGAPLVALFTGPIRQLLGLFQRLGNGTAKAHNKVATLATETIPQARHDAVVTANGYTDNLRTEIEAALSSALANVAGYPSESDAKTMVADAQRYGGLTWDFTGLVAAGIVAADEYLTAHAGDVTGAIATASATITANITAMVKRIESDLVTRLQGDETSLAALATTVTTTIPTEIATKVNEATATENQKLTAQVQTLQGQVTTLQGQITALTTQITGWQSQITTAVAEIASLQSQQTVDVTAIQAQQAIITTAQANITNAVTAISNLESQITGISSTLAPIHAAQQLNTLQLAPFEALGAVALPTLLATLSTTLNQVKTKVDTCVVTTCDPTSPQNIKNVLSDLLGILSAAGEIGFIAEAVKNPEGTAAALAPFLDTVDRSAVGLLDALLSL
jgi:prefoldin subunit 5